MDKMYWGLLQKICDNVDLKTWGNVLTLNKKINNLKHKIIIKHLMYYKRIKHLDNFDNFENIIVSEIVKWPLNVRKITFTSQFNQDIRNSIPNYVTHLCFGDRFNQDVKDCIPNSVTHLTFGYDFNQDVKDCIPNSITHLTFGQFFNQDIKGCIPQFCHSFNFWRSI